MTLKSQFSTGDRVVGTLTLRVRRDGDRIRVTTDSPHAWHLRVGGPDGILHTVEPGPGVTEIPCGD